MKNTKHQSSRDKHEEPKNPDKTWRQPILETMGSRVIRVIQKTSQTASVPIGSVQGNRCYEWSAGWSQWFVYALGGVERSSK